MTKHYANRPSQSHLKYVTNSQGVLVPNMAYKESAQNKMSKIAETLTTLNDFCDDSHSEAADTVLHTLKGNTTQQRLEGLADGITSYEDYLETLNCTTATHNRSPDKKHRGISGYLYMVGDILNVQPSSLSQRTQGVLQEKLNTIREGTVPIQGVIWRGVPTKKYTEKDGEIFDYLTSDELDAYVESKADELTDNNSWKSFSMSPGTALGFSYGVATPTKAHMRKASRMIQEGVHDGLLIAMINPEGYPLEYADRHRRIQPNNLTCEYEVLIRPGYGTDIVDIIYSHKSPFNKPIVIMQ